MPKPRGKSHTTLTETATEVVRVLERIPGVKMIAPGEIRTTKRATAGKRFVTAVFTTAGFELIITGQSVQKVAVHTINDAKKVFDELTQHKRLAVFTFAIRDRKPGL
jgi:hypothetical protein